MARRWDLVMNRPPFTHDDVTRAHLHLFSQLQSSNYTLLPFQRGHQRSERNSILAHFILKLGISFTLYYNRYGLFYFFYLKFFLFLSRARRFRFQSRILQGWISETAC